MTTVSNAPNFSVWANDLCYSFKKIGHRTSFDLRHAWAAGLSFGEETITETNLLELNRRHPQNVVLRSFTKKQEALNGADWEWWFLNSQRTIGFPMRVQAKRLSKRAKGFKNLLTYQARSARLPQIEMLIRDAQAFGMIPLHCFYVEENRMRYCMPRSTVRNRGFNPGYELGCWIGLSSSIKAINNQDIWSLSRILFPWHLLVCPEQSTRASLPNRVREALIRSSTQIRNYSGSIEDIPGVVTRLPTYIQSLLDGASVVEVLTEVSERRLGGILLIVEPEGSMV